MKAQTSLLVKGIYLILLLITIAIVVNRITSTQLTSAQQERALRQRARADSLLQTLAGNVNCLAYEEKGNLEGKTLELSSHRILEKKKLDDFSSQYYDIQPSCARDFIFGYRVYVETFLVNVSSEDVLSETSLSTGSSVASVVQFSSTNCRYLHSECSQACNYLNYETYYPRYKYLGLGNCPAGVYGCMSRECCIGQCDSKSGKCYCANTTFVTIYGNVCPPGYYCSGEDCMCHPLKTSPKEKIRLTIPAMSWSFGDFEFSEKEALKGKISISIPIDVFVDESTRIPGKMSITLVDGELEEFRGFIDMSCLTGKDFQNSFSFHYPIFLEQTDSEKKMCLEISGKKVCQKLACPKTIDFSGLTPGTYRIYSKNEDNVLKVIV